MDNKPIHSFPKGNKFGGRKPISPDMKKAFEAATPDAIEIILSLMKNSKDDNVRLKAANIILERHLGKPVQPIDNSDKDIPFLIKVV